MNRLEEKLRRHRCDRRSRCKAQAQALKRRNGKRVISVTPAHVALDTIERDPTPKTTLMEIVESSAEGPAGSDQVTDAPGERESVESTAGAVSSTPHDEDWS